MKGLDGPFSVQYLTSWTVQLVPQQRLQPQERNHKQLNEKKGSNPLWRTLLFYLYDKKKKESQVCRALFMLHKKMHPDGWWKINSNKKDIQSCPIFCLHDLAIFFPVWLVFISETEQKCFSFFSSFGHLPAERILLWMVVLLVKWTGRHPGVQLQPSGDVWTLVVKNISTTICFLLALSDFSAILVKCLS